MPPLRIPFDDTPHTAKVAQEAWARLPAGGTGWSGIPQRHEGVGGPAAQQTLLQRPPAEEWTRAPHGLAQHLNNHHARRHECVASGTNQLPKQSPCSPRTSSLEGSQEKTSHDPLLFFVPPSNQHFRPHRRPLEMILGKHGPSAVRRSSLHRRVLNAYCDCEFVQRFLLYLLLAGGRLEISFKPVQLDQPLSGSQLGHLMTSHGQTMFPLAADAFVSPDLVLWRQALHSQMVRRGELVVLFRDATMKVSLGLKNQVRHRDGGESVPPGSGGGAWTMKLTPWCIQFSLLLVLRSLATAAKRSRKGLRPCFVRGGAARRETLGSMVCCGQPVCGTDHGPWVWLWTRCTSP